MKTRNNTQKILTALLAFVMVFSGIFGLAVLPANAAAEDVLTSGNYILTEESYDASAMMKMPACIAIDAEADTFNIYPFKDGAADLNTNKGTGTVSFDEATGVYTLTYTNKENATSTFTATADSITFTSAMHYGGAKMNILDEEGNFIPYTALKEVAATFEDVLTSGNYILTEESYDPSAMMKLGAFIVIDAEADTFNIYPYKEGVADLETNKGTGTVSFDTATGVYTLTYTNKENATSTFTATADSITFTSAMHYGTAKMNILDENGNFIPYTALKEVAATFEDVLTSGNYILTEESYDPSAMMKLGAFIVIDAEADTFNIYPYKEGVADLETNKGTGTISFDAATGVYTLTYTNKENATSTFTATADSITFTSAMHYGTAKMNILDENGNFIPYTAMKEVAATFDDVLTSGNYILTEESYDASAMMKLPACIAIDAEADTFNIYPYKDGAADLETNKGTGTVSFDETTGVYTLTYTNKENATSTFTATADSITFTSAMHYGGAKMNILDENGNFIPYTALKEAAPVFEDVLTSGNYILTEESYDASAMMKLPACIAIDAEADTFNIYPYKDGAADLETNKGTGTVSFDETTGVYTLTYTNKENAVSTFTATEDSITFTSAMHYGNAKMNILDENGNFIPYTALKEVIVEPEQTEPEQTEPEQTEPEQTEPEQTEPEQTEPEQTEPEQTEPEQTEPEQTQPEETKPAVKPDTPATGDNSQLVLPAVMLVISVLALTGLGIALHQKKIR